MNCYYVYQYDNGLQFVSTGDPVAIRVSVERQNGPSYPRVLGRWKIKEWKVRNPDRAIVSDFERAEFIRENIELFKQLTEASGAASWSALHRCPSGIQIAELARKKYGFSPKTSNQDIVNGFWWYYKDIIKLT